MAIATATAFFVFFRNPDRLFPANPKFLTSPADGVVLDVSTDARRIRLSIFLSVFDVHVQYAPCDGQVIAQRYKRGQFNPAYIAKKSAYNERLETDILTKHGDVITVVQIAGQFANRIDTFVGKGLQVSRGCRLGLIKFGSRVDLIVPNDKYTLAKNISPGSRVIGGETVLFVPSAF